MAITYNKTICQDISNRSDRLINDSTEIATNSNKNKLQNFLYLYSKVAPLYPGTQGSLCTELDVEWTLYN